MAFVIAIEELFRQTPLPEAPYPSTARRLKRMKGIMKKRKNREHWLKLISETHVIEGPYSYSRPRTIYRCNLHEGTLLGLAQGCGVPLDPVVAIYTLIFG